MTPSSSPKTKTPSQLIDARVKELGDWRGETLESSARADQGSYTRRSRRVEVARSSDLVRQGMICTGETYKDVVKMTFAKGAALADPAGLFNSSLEGNVRRAIDFREGEKINEKALKTLLRAAAALNWSTAKR